MCLPVYGWVEAPLEVVGAVHGLPDHVDGELEDELVAPAGAPGQLLQAPLRTLYVKVVLLLRRQNVHAALLRVERIV